MKLLLVFVATVAAKVSDFSDYRGVSIKQDKAYVTFGKDKDVKIYRNAEGKLIFEANAIDFVATRETLTVNGGEPLVAAPIEDVNECLKNNGGCHRARNCYNTVGSMECSECGAGWEDEGATGCKDIDECLDNDGGCHEKRKCVNTEGSVNCEDCPKGWINEGEKGCKGSNIVLQGAGIIPDEWLKESGKDSLGELLFRATRDGWDSHSNFHSRCDDKGATIMVCHSPHGDYIFGGYTTQSWREYGNYRTDTESWLYWLKCQAGIPERKMDVKMDGNQVHAIYPHNSYGPTFGGGHDIYLEGNMQNGYINWGHTYPLPSGYDCSFIDGHGCGSGHQMCKELEVWTVV